MSIIIFLKSLFLSKERFESLKKALTVFTNQEEKGYPDQQKLHNWLIKQKKPIYDIIRGNDWKKTFLD